MLFSSVIGHASLKAKLIGNVREGRVPHAQLVVGPRGSGHLALALAYAQYLLCTNKGVADACGSCPDCLQMARLEHPDLHAAFPIFLSDKVKVCDPHVAEWRKAVRSEPYLDLEQWRDMLESENKQLRMGVDVAAEIQRKLSLRSFRGGYKVMLIWLPELMDHQAANKLLKVLEEPEPGTVFLLVCTDATQLMATILSRTQLVKVAALTEDDVVELLSRRYPELPADDARTLARRSGGDALEAVAMAEKGEEELFVLFRDWLRVCYRGDVAEAVTFGEQFQKMGRERQKALMRLGLYMMRQCTMQWQDVPDLVRVAGLELEFVQRFSTLLNARSVDGIRRELETAHGHIERNANPKVLFLDMSYRFMGLLRAGR